METCVKNVDEHMRDVVHIKKDTHIRMHTKQKYSPNKSIRYMNTQTCTYQPYNFGWHHGSIHTHLSTINLLLLFTDAMKRRMKRGRRIFHSFHVEAEERNLHFLIMADLGYHSLKWRDVVDDVCCERNNGHKTQRARICWLPRWTV